jgi:hypothetical protein
MDSIHKKQIDEVLNYDRNINSMVVALEKKQVERMTDNVLPYTQLNKVNISSAKGIINPLTVLLEKNQTDIRTLTSKATNTREFALSIQELGLIQEVMQKWNAICEIYNTNGNTQQTKESILYLLRKIISFINFIINGLNVVIEKFVRNFVNMRGNIDEERANTKRIITFFQGLWKY